MRRILVVPYALLTELSESFLDRRILKVRTVKDASEALAAAAVWPPDLIIFDSHIPGMSVSDFCRTVREDEWLANTRLLMLTTRYGDTPEDVSGADVDAHLVAPVEEAELLQSVGFLMDVKRRRSVRLRVELLASVSVAKADGDKQTMMANVLGLSETGLLLETELQLVIGGEIGITVVLPQTDQRLNLVGIVLSADELMLQYAVELIDLTTDDAETIRSFVAGKLAGPTAKSQAE
jgi:DNA-binding response OmpR family regulator